MTDHANELRRYARKIAHPAGDVPSVMLAAADEIERLAATLEAAESEALEQARLNGMGSEREAVLMAKLEAAEKDIAVKEEVIDSLAAVVKRLDAQCDAAERERDECTRRRLEAADHFAAQTELMKKKCDALHAKITEMEKQEPARLVTATAYRWRYRGAVMWQYGEITEETARRAKEHNHEVQPLYALPGAQPAPSFADAYQGAMEEAAIWKKRALEAEDLNRKFIAEINGPTHMGEPAQPAPSVPDGFSREDLEAVADGLDGYEKTVNVGNVTGEGDDHLESTTAYAARFIRAMLAAAPEAKPCP